MKTDVTLAVPLLAGVSVSYNTQQLLQLDLCRRQGTVPPMLRKGNSPLNIEEWRRLLRDHLDVELVQYLLAGITEGFRIGFDYSKTCTSEKCNLSLAEDNPEVVTTYLQKEVDLGRVISPLPKEVTPEVHISLFGVIPKGNQPGK